MRAWLVLLLLGPFALPLRAADSVENVTRRDDGYHFAAYAGRPHDSTYAEWWYFNLSDPVSGLQLAVTYAVLDPANKSGSGLASVAAIAYTPAGQFTETNAYPHTSFLASADQADVVITGGAPASPNFVQVLSDDAYRIVGRVTEDHDVSWDLLYVRRAPAWFGSDRQHVGVLPWEEMSWLQYMPGASVTGSVVIDGHRYRVTGVRGYHDHNWGEWVPFFVAWNWAQYFEPGLDFSIGDFRNSAAGVVSIDALGTRTVFEKGQYELVHEGWRYDASHQVWFPTRTWLYARSGDRALIVRMQALDTVPVLPPPELPLPLVPVIYEQTANFLGWLWEQDQTGEWTLVRSFQGGGFKEYTDITAVPRP